MNIFKCMFQIKPKFKIGEKITALFVLENLSKQEYTILTRGTPLDLLGSGYVTVTHEGNELQYDSIFAKRGTPSANEFKVIKPGGRLTSEIDITDSYSISQAGIYTLSTEFYVAYFTVSPEEAALQDYQMTEQVTAESVSFEVVESDLLSANPVKTDGQKARGREASIQENLGETESTLSSSPTAPNILKAPNTENSENCKKAHYLVYEYLTGILKNMNVTTGNTHYNMWFGTDNTTRQARVKGFFEKIKYTLESTVKTEQITYEFVGLTDPLYDKAYAYTYKDTRTIYICKFWVTASLTGSDSKMGTFLHELTHAICSIDDYKDTTYPKGYYGRTACKKLAKDEPANAINNADNYEYFTETQYMYWDSFEDPDNFIKAGSTTNAALCSYLTALYSIHKGESTNQLYYMQNNGAAWTFNNKIEGAFTDAIPTASVFKDKLYTAFKQPASNIVQYIGYDKTLKWDDKVQIIPNVNTNLSPEFIVYNDKLYLFYVDAENEKIKYTTFDGSKWENPESVAPPTGVASKSAPSAAVLDGKLYVFYTNASNILCTSVLGDFPPQWKSEQVRTYSDDITAYSPFAVTINDVIRISFVNASKEIIQVQGINVPALKKVLWVGNESVTANSNLTDNPKSNFAVAVAEHNKHNYAVFKPHDKNNLWVMKQRTY